MNNLPCHLGVSNWILSPAYIVYTYIVVFRVNNCIPLLISNL